MRLAIFTKNRTNPAYAAARLGAERAAERHGASVVHYVPKKPDDIAEQRALIGDALAAQHDAFVLVPVHVVEMNEAIGRVLDADIPVVTLLNRPTMGKFVSFVGADDYRIGLEVARYLARHLEGRGKVVLMEGMPGATTGADRIRAFGDALKDFPGIEIVATLKGEYQQPAARKVMEAFLVAAPTPPDAVLAANDAMALGVLEALEARGLRIAVTGVNAVPDAIAAIRRGALLATADFDAMKIASIATEAAIRHLRGERVPTEISLPAQVVDRTNFAPWDKPLEARVVPRWEDVVPGG